MESQFPSPSSPPPNAPAGNSTPPTSTTSPTCTCPLEQYGILKLIFEYLPFHDLLSASQVSKQWSEIGQIIRRQRQELPKTPTPHLILYHPYSIADSKLAVDFFNHQSYGLDKKVSSECHLWSKSPTSIDGGDLGPSPRVIIRTKLDNIPLQFESDKIGDQLLEQVKRNYWEPSLLVCNWSKGACPFSLHLDDMTLPPDTVCPPFLEKLKSIVPVLGFSNYNGEIFTVPTTRTPENVHGIGESLELEHKKFPLVSGIILPKIHGIHFDRIDLRFGTSDFVDGTGDWKLLTSKIPSMEPGYEVKGIALLHSIPQNDPGLGIEFRQYFLQNPSIAFAGGLVERVISTSRNDTGTSGDVMASALIISGRQNLKVGSVLLADHRMTENNRLQLTRFKDAGLDAPGTTTFAFMFACCGRGRRMHRGNHVESHLFRSLYPTTPLIGSFTEGEYFHGFIPGQGVAESSGTVQYSYSTAFLFVSYSNN